MIRVAIRTITMTMMMTMTNSVTQRHVEVKSMLPGKTFGCCRNLMIMILVMMIAIKVGRGIFRSQIAV